MKLCHTCKEDKPLSSFSKDRTKPDGICPRCKSCSSINSRKRREKYPEEVRRNNLKRFGLTLESYEAKKQAQGGVCAICRGLCVTGRNLAIDHCHTSGKNRSLLCAACNTSLGLLKDSPELFYRSAEYLIYWRSEHAHTD